MTIFKPDNQLCLDDPTRLALGGQPIWKGSCPPLQGDVVQQKLTIAYFREC